MCVSGCENIRLKQGGLEGNDDAAVRRGLFGGLAAIVDAGEQVADEMNASEALVVGADDIPGRDGGVGAEKHGVAGAAVAGPVFHGDVVDGRNLPLFQRIRAAVGEALLLFGFRDVEIIFQEDGSRADQHVFVLRHGDHEALILLVVAEAHHPLDAGAVVPAPVEDHEFARGGKMRSEALEIPFAPFAVGGRAQRDDARLAGTEMLDDALDDAVLAGGVAAFEDHQQFAVARDDVALEFHQFDLKLVELLLVALVRQRGRVCRSFGAAHLTVFRKGRSREPRPTLPAPEDPVSPQARQRGLIPARGAASDML